MAWITALILLLVTSVRADWCFLSKIPPCNCECEALSTEEISKHLIPALNQHKSDVVSAVNQTVADLIRTLEWNFQDNELTGDMKDIVTEINNLMLNMWSNSTSILESSVKKNVQEAVRERLGKELDRSLETHHEVSMQLGTERDSTRNGPLWNTDEVEKLVVLIVVPASVIIILLTALSTFLVFTIMKRNSPRNSGYVRVVQADDNSVLGTGIDDEAESLCSVDSAIDEKLF